MNIIDLPPFAPTLIESTRAIGYSLEAAVADIIDNSIAAGATDVRISFFPVDDSYVSILDNGRGMDSEELTIAMQYGSKNPLDIRDDQDLGRFGLGLKTASLSQCRKLTVASKKEGTVTARRWDIDYVRKTGKWSLLDMDSESELSQIPNIAELMNNDSGTLVVWEELDRLKAGEIDFAKSMGRMIDGVREHLALVFHRYLTGETGIKKIQISINDNEVMPIDPFFVKKSNRPMDDEVFIIHDSRIKVRPYILPHFSSLTAEEVKRIGGKDGLRKSQGFYVYRNKRLLVWGTWFRMQRKGDLSKLARIQVDIPNTLDDLWTLDIKKSYALPPAEVRANLHNIIEKIADQSKRKYTVRGKREVGDKTVHVWNRMKDRSGGVYYEINKEYPLVEQLIKLHPEDKNLVLEMIKQIEMGLPLNQLYVDLNNDEYLTNDLEQKDGDIETGLRAMINQQEENFAKLDILDRMSRIEPFSKHPMVIEKIRKEVFKNGQYNG